MCAHGKTVCLAWPQPSPLQRGGHETQAAQAWEESMKLCASVQEAPLGKEQPRSPLARAEPVGVLRCAEAPGGQLCG